MSLTPAVLDAMVASGCTAEQVAAVVKASLVEVNEKAEEKRAKDRERKRRQRERDSSECHATSHDVTRTKCDIEEKPLSLPPNENNSNPPTHTPGTQTPARVRADDFPMPEFCEDPQVWRDFKANRKAKRLPCTPTAHAKLLRDIEKLSDDEWPPGRLFEEIVARGWAAAHDPRDDRKPANDRRPTGNSNQRTAVLAAAKVQSLGGA